MDRRPLAERQRPETLDAVLGQQHLVGAGKIIREIIEHKQPTSLILWGPPGTGKTTLARIIARETGAEFMELSAVTAGKADVLKSIEHAQQNRRLGMQTILFVDEIHRFNKAQQDAFLPHVEDGTIILVGATTENPSFEVINPLLSRSRVLVLERTNARTLTPEQIEGPCDLTVVDASFIGLEKLAAALALCTRSGGTLVALIKPQFEVGKEEAARVKGIVRDDAMRHRVFEDVSASLTAAGFEVKAVQDCVIEGPKGNREAFVHATRRATS